jgi:hypothetical protein
MARTKAKPKPAPAPEPEPDEDLLWVIPPAEQMTIQYFRMHLQARHARLGFWTLNEHDQDHRIRETALDHVHEEEPD